MRASLNNHPPPCPPPLDLPRSLALPPLPFPRNLLPGEEMQISLPPPSFKSSD